MKKIIKITATFCLFYAILMLLIDGTYSLLSLNQRTNIGSLIEDKLVPYIISLASMIYCIFHIWQHSVGSLKYLAPNEDSISLYNKWLYYILAESFVILIYCLSWIIGFNPVILIGMLVPNLTIFACFNVIVLSLLTMMTTYYILRWNQIAIWFVSLIGITVIAFFIIEPFCLLCDKNESVDIDAQILIFNAFLQILYIICYLILSKVYKYIFSPTTS